jgi:hypothetical protein
LWAVITTSSRHRLSRWVSWGKWPCATEAVKGAERHVLLVGHAAAQATQADTRQADQPGKIAFPKLLCGRRITLLERAKPARDGAFGGSDAMGSGPPRQRRAGECGDVIVPPASRSSQQNGSGSQPIAGEQGII